MRGFNGAGFSPKSRVWTSTNWIFESLFSSLERGVGIWNLWPSSLLLFLFEFVVSALVETERVSVYGVSTDLELAFEPVIPREAFKFYLGGLGLDLEPRLAAA